MFVMLANTRLRCLWFTNIVNDFIPRNWFAFLDRAKLSFATQRRTRFSIPCPGTCLCTIFFHFFLAPFYFFRQDKLDAMSGRCTSSLSSADHLMFSHMREIIYSLTRRTVSDMTDVNPCVGNIFENCECNKA